MIDLDLDKLQDPVKKVKIHDKVMDLKYPSLQQLAKMLQLAEDVKSEDTGVVLKVIVDLSGLFRELIPELGDYELNMNQIFALIQLFVEISTPEEVKGEVSDTKKN